MKRHWFNAYSATWIIAGVVVLLLVLAFCDSAQAGIGDELNTSIQGLTNLQFKPLKGRVMQATGVYAGCIWVTLLFMDGVEEGRTVSRLDKGALDVKVMNSTAKTYGTWKFDSRTGKVKYFYCAAHGGLWSKYETINGYPSFFIYSAKVAQTLNPNGKAEAPATFAPDQSL